MRRIFNGKRYPLYNIVIVVNKLIHLKRLLSVCWTCHGHAITIHSLLLQGLLVCLSGLLVNNASDRELTT